MATSAAHANKKKSSIAGIVTQSGAPLHLYANNKVNGNISSLKNAADEQSRNVSVSKN